MRREFQGSGFLQRGDPTSSCVLPGRQKNKAQWPNQQWISTLHCRWSRVGVRQDTGWGDGGKGEGRMCLVAVVNAKSSLARPKRVPIMYLGFGDLFDG
jgi:hypothetical protein